MSHYDLVASKIDFYSDSYHIVLTHIDTSQLNNCPCYFFIMVHALFSEKLYNNCGITRYYEMLKKVREKLLGPPL